MSRRTLAFAGLAVGLLATRVFTNGEFEQYGCGSVANAGARRACVQGARRWTSRS